MNALAAGLVWVSFGSFGRQLAHVGRAANRDVYVGYKWRESSRHWVGPLRIPRFKILAALTPDEIADPVVRHALSAGGPGRPACDHQEHAGLVSSHATGEPPSGDPR